MAGSFTYTPYSPPLARPSEPVYVFRMTGEGATARFEPMPHLRVSSVEFREGAFPAAAQFRYAFDELLPPEYPQRFEDCWPLNGVTNRYAVRADDRLVVRSYDDDGAVATLFDGFAGMPQLDLSAGRETVTFQCMGTPVRCWDTPMGGAIYRDADDPDEGFDIQGDLPVRFNPDGKANCTPDTATEAGTGLRNYPTFVDGGVIGDDPTKGRKWTLEGAVRYLLYAGNPDEEFVVNPADEEVKDILWARLPADGKVAMDPNDPDTFQVKPIVIGEYDATNDVWPEAIDKLIGPYGFSMRFRLETDLDDNPAWSLIFYRTDDDGQAKQVALQKAGETLDPGLTNVQGVRLVRDTAGMYNRVSLDTRPDRLEVSVVLVPGFEIGGSDGTAANRVRFTTGDPAFETGTNSLKYRMYVLDECGEGHWSFEDAETVRETPDLTLFLGDTYIIRRRPPIKTLFTKDAKGQPREAELWIYKGSGYTGDIPGVWTDRDPTGWLKVAKAGWKLLEDRCGVMLTCADPNDWEVCDPKDDVHHLTAGGAVRGVEWQASGDFNKEFILRLTCVIEGDADMDVVADRRVASPTKYAVTRSFDVRDRYVINEITEYSHFAVDAAGEDNGTAGVVRDDTDDATDYAAALRRSSELAKYSGSIAIPRLTTDYEIGDRIVEIDGREVDLAMNAAADQDEGNVYPVVTGIAWSFEGAQGTTLTLGSPLHS
jgi:hypothetical protein